MRVLVWAARVCRTLKQCVMVYIHGIVVAQITDHPSTMAVDGHRYHD